ncbi:MAG TPA: thiamine diphosphokinase [Syntrophales bacterium]|nr:thiamine diphosphokinase [Syntrophales bacterium]
MKKVIIVVAGGEIRDMEFFRSKVSQLRAAEIICADSGARYLHAIGLVPDVIIGDMDSIGPGVLRYFTERGSRIIRFPEGKNETDTQLAMEQAFGSAPDEIYVFGAFGTRIDHALANISLLAMGVKKGIDIRLIDEWCETFVAGRKCTIIGEPGQTVSLLPLSDTVTGITLKGFEYPLANGTMEIGRPYGVSNRLAAAKGVITVEAGSLLVIRYFRVGDLP